MSGVAPKTVHGLIQRGLLKNSDEYWHKKIGLSSFQGCLSNHPGPFIQHSNSSDADFNG
jgi:hypothetical protein